MTCTEYLSTSAIYPRPKYSLYYLAAIHSILASTTFTAGPSLYAPNILNPEPPREDGLPAMVRRLQQPYPDMYKNNYTKVMLSITWTVSMTGPGHFESNEGASRRVLRNESILQTSGQNSGCSYLMTACLTGKWSSEEKVFFVEEVTAKRPG